MRDDDDDGAARGPGVPRRGLVRGALAGLGGLAAAGGLPAGAAHAVPADPGAGPEVTPNPIVPRIPKSRISVELADFSAPPPTSATPQLALLNFVYHAGPGSGRLLAADSRGKIWDIDRSTGAATLFFDFAAARGGALVTAARYTLGLRSFAFHPDFARRSRPGFRKFYTVSTETVASRTGSAPLFTDNYPVDHHDVVAEWTMDASGQRVNVASRRELLRIAMYLFDHNTDTLMFDPNARPGSAAYGKMFITVGDGGNVPRGPDPYNQVQNPLRALGKILRIDPIASGGRPYTVPADNPFVGRATHLPELWALGLRHPQNLCFDPGGGRAMILTDIGQAQIEEVNLGVRGANYGWPVREGTFVTDRLNTRALFALPADDAARGFTYPVAQYDHGEGQAIAGGYVYRGSAVPALVGHYLFGDIVRGRIFHVPVADLRLGALAPFRELVLKRNGVRTTLRAIIAGAVGRNVPRADLRFGQDDRGEVYVVTKQDGRIRRMLPG